MLRLISLLGKKWSLLILHSFAKEKIQTYNSLIKKTNKKINPTILSQRLKDFQKRGLVKKDEKNRYEITSFGLHVSDTMHIIKKEALKRGYAVPQRCMGANAECSETINDM